MAIITANLGTQLTITSTVANPDGSPFALFNCALAWTLHQPGDLNGALAPVVQLTWTDGGASNGVTVSDPATGVAVVVLTGAQSSALLALNRRYPWDLVVTDASAVSTIAASGAIDIVPGVSSVIENYCTIDDVKARIERKDDLTDTQLQAIVTAASRLIDRLANRRFYQYTDTKYFTAERPSYLAVDDLISVSSLKTDISGTRVWDTLWATTDYDLTPDNATGINWPYTAIRQRPFTSRWFPTLRKGVQVAGVWGWPVVPQEIVEATILQAERLFIRKNSPYGVAGMGDFGKIVIPRADPDVLALVAPYQRISVGAV